jgi:hypothetical protein
MDFSYERICITVKFYHLSSFIVMLIIIFAINPELIQMT